MRPELDPKERDERDIKSLFQGETKEIMEIIIKISFSTRYPRCRQHPEISSRVSRHRKLRCRPHSPQEPESGV